MQSLTAISIETPSMVSHIAEPLSSKPHHVQLFDIRSDTEQQSLRDELDDMLNKPAAVPMRLPFLLLYDNAGLQLFEEVTKLQSYYPTRTETQILSQYSDDLVQGFQDNAILIELGSGSLYKTQKILDAIERSGKKNVSYFALDVDRQELQRCLAQLPRYQNVHCFGLWGTFEDGFRWMQSMSAHQGSLNLLFLGSSIGNFDRSDAAKFMSCASKVLRPGTRDSFYIAFDHCANPDKIWNAYHDAAGTNQRFLLNALSNANDVYGSELFDLSAWCADGRINEKKSCHELFFRALCDTRLGPRKFAKGECLHLGHNIKYPKLELQHLLKSSALRQVQSWQNPEADYALYKLQPARTASLA